MSRPIVTLLTDFGTADGYVAEMKGVMLAAAPDASLVDVAHDIAPQDVDAARLALARYWRRFPVRTVHVAVVDPGVGSTRAAIAVASEERFLVGPDNGVLSPALLVPDARVVALPVPPSAAATFHGRDVFAPAAAALARGAALDDLGAPFDTPIVRRTPQPTRGADGTIGGEVIAIDRFGNAITNLLVRAPGGTVRVADVAIPIRRVYADVAPGAAVALVGSHGLLEIAVREGSAAERLRLHRGARVTLDGGR